MGRKKIFILVCMLTVSFYALADSEMNDLGGGVIGQVGNKATALAAKIHTAGKSRVAVLDFYFAERRRSHRIGKIDSGTPECAFGILIASDCDC